MAAKTWRALWYRESDRTVSFSRREAVEHEALAMLMASDHGVNAQAPLAVGVAGDDMALLARTARGEPLTEPTPDLLERAWDQVVKLHRRGGVRRRRRVPDGDLLHPGRRGILRNKWLEDGGYS